MATFQPFYAVGESYYYRMYYDLDKLVDAGAYISDFLQRKSGSRVATAIMNKRLG